MCKVCEKIKEVKLRSTIKKLDRYHKVYDNESVTTFNLTASNYWDDVLARYEYCPKCGNKI